MEGHALLRYFLAIYNFCKAEPNSDSSKDKKIKVWQMGGHVHWMFTFLPRRFQSQSSFKNSSLLRIPSNTTFLKYTSKYSSRFYSFQLPLSALIPLHPGTCNCTWQHIKKMKRNPPRSREMKPLIQTLDGNGSLLGVVKKRLSKYRRTSYKEEFSGFQVT